MNTCCVECVVLQLCNRKTIHDIQKMIQISREYFTWCDMQQFLKENIWCLPPQGSICDPTRGWSSPTGGSSPTGWSSATVVPLPPAVGGVTPLPRWVVGADPLPLEVDPLAWVVDPLSPAVSGVTPLPMGVGGVGLLPPAINGLACVGPVACFGCVVRLLVTIPGLDDIAAIYCSAILACCLVVGSPLDSDHVLGARLSGTGVLKGISSKLHLQMEPIWQCYFAITMIDLEIVL